MLYKVKNIFVKYRYFIICIMICLLVGSLGKIATDTSTNWYQGLNRPMFTPPSWAFGVAWTILYIMMGFAWALVLSDHDKILESHRRRANIFFVIQLFFNAIWPFIYFSAHKITLAWIDINLLWLSLLYTIYLFSKVSKKATYLLMPYLLWVSFANILNGSIWWLNRSI